mgnify:CR=1 FL=1
MLLDVQGDINAMQKTMNELEKLSDAEIFCKKRCRVNPCGKLCEYVQCYLAGLKAGRKKTEKQWHDCFLTCSSPYCAGHFQEVKCEGTLGNMSKREGE